MSFSKMHHHTLLQAHSDLISASRYSST